MNFFKNLARWLVDYRQAELAYESCRVVRSVSFANTNS
jgi:hypothetical protein